MVSNNIWYLDRGKNFFCDESEKNFFEIMISIFNTISVENLEDSSKIFSFFPNKYKNSGNPAALLTTLRNIGIINKKNKLGENITYYLSKKLTYKELIFENLTKINYDKENSCKVKPFVIICMVLCELYNINPKEAYITKDECVNYLFNIKEYDRYKIYNTAKMILSRDRTSSKDSAGVLDIWFNALEEFDMFKKDNKSNTLTMNEKEIEFFRYIYFNGDKITCYSNEESPFESVYDELGNASTGINEIIPEIEFIDDVFVDFDNIYEVYNYLFAIGKPDQNKFFKKDCYGIFKPFNSIKNIVIRKIEKSNKQIAELLFEYNYISVNKDEFEENDESKKVQEDIKNKSEIKKFLENKEIYLKNNWSYAKKQNDEDTFWINPRVEILKEDWYFVLNDQKRQEIIIILIPKNTLKARDEIENGVLIRKDRPNILNIELYLKDFRIQGTNYMLEKYIIKRIRY